MKNTNKNMKKWKKERIPQLKKYGYVFNCYCGKIYIVSEKCESQSGSVWTMGVITRSGIRSAFLAGYKLNSVMNSFKLLTRIAESDIGLIKELISDPN